MDVLARVEGGGSRRPPARDDDRDLLLERRRRLRGRRGFGASRPRLRRASLSGREQCAGPCRRSRGVVVFSTAGPPISASARPRSSRLATAANGAVAMPRTVTKAFSASRSCASPARWRRDGAAPRGQELGGRGRHVLELVGDDVDRRGEGGERGLVVVGGAGLVRRRRRRRGSPGRGSRCGSSCRGAPRRAPACGRAGRRRGCR